MPWTRTHQSRRSRIGRAIAKKEPRPPGHEGPGGQGMIVRGSTSAGVAPGVASTALGPLPARGLHARAVAEVAGRGEEGEPEEKFHTDLLSKLSVGLND